MEKIYQIFPQELVTFVLVTLFSLLIGLSQRKISLRKEGEGAEKTFFGTDRTFTFIGILGYLLYILDKDDLRLFMCCSFNNYPYYSGADFNCSLCNRANL